ncbi:hypothetical protein TWF225_000473 [Orbilia oligospora]|nr:hypothetical protein TWF225_000473 [Orbilia oligospora]KAF3264532.1 hypothetical protein TWF128_001002 [Orbilia oligospora]KAF3268326.1 hypothetical protein TWF217_010921 [Orbilia oligospora]
MRYYTSRVKLPVQKERKSFVPGFYKHENSSKTCHMGTVIGGFYYSTYLYNNTKIKADRADGNSGSGDDDGIDAALDEAIEFVEGILEVDKDEDVLLLAAFMSKLLQLRYRRQHKRPATSGNLDRAANAPELT